MAVNQNQFESDQRRLPPNRRLQLTPLRGPEIVAILKADYSSTVISIYRCGATEAQHVGRSTPIHISSSSTTTYSQSEYTMTFQNPLHRLSLHDGARALTVAMADWAILQVDSSGQVLPLWILNHIHDDVIETHQLVPQNTFQLFECFKNTAMWHGFLYSLSYETERRFLADQLEETSVNLQRATSSSSVTFSYPYQHSHCWHHPSDHERLAHVNWVIERMMGLPYDDALRFMENVIVDWLRIYAFDELPTNNGQLDTLDLRRGYMLYVMALEFETVALNSPDECEKYFARYKKPEALKHRP